VRERERMGMGRISAHEGERKDENGEEKKGGGGDAVPGTTVDGQPLNLQFLLSWGNREGWEAVE
jgi:hypothetical protein